MFRILYRFLAGFARLVVRSGRSEDLEIIVLDRVPWSGGVPSVMLGVVRPGVGA